jgi:hypothetical protein
MSCKNNLTIITLLILAGATIYLSYNTVEFYLLNNANEISFNKTAKCKFSAVNYTIDDKRLAIISHTNLSSESVTLYYPLNYLETYFLRSYNTTIYRLFFETLNNKTFRCRMSDKLKQSYFYDYSIFDDIKELVTAKEVFMMFAYMLIIIVSILISVLILLCISYCCIKNRKTKYTYNRVTYF